MPFEQDVKELAYVIDPPCWVSYSGKGRNFKAAMDDRRNKALAKAQDEIDRIKERRMPKASPGKVTVHPTIHFVLKQNDDKWLRMTFPDLDSDELEELSDHLGEKLGWFTWYTEMPD